MDFLAFTDIERRGEYVIVRLDAIAAVTPTEYLPNATADGVYVAEIECTQILLTNGSVVYVHENTAEVVERLFDALGTCFTRKGRIFGKKSGACDVVEVS